MINVDKSTRTGLARCVEAFERLKSDSPVVPAHLGIAGSKVTAGIVSVEAGFDRGYLKKARSSHAPLIGLIECFRKGQITGVQSPEAQVRRAREKVARAAGELEEVRSMLYRVLTQNIQLVERIRALEEELKNNKIIAIRQ
ncbi:hypothetical protein [Pseudomonas synxantha]|uniref:hypothetical protein n=1 Tax=Pseudomonas synxantha TaxID=47883 RepID=UPI000614512F|nr:hypothetical protein [Pseudomonas synxantha]